jgi:hypothetical protein
MDGRVEAEWEEGHEWRIDRDFRVNIQYTSPWIPQIVHAAQWLAGL